mgnify:CR=1 FL=1|tara:strand:+ start:3476 stop:3778 length:303 start_codon:yes stop_codon:yes gene_type:complete
MKFIRSERTLFIVLCSLLFLMVIVLAGVLLQTYREYQAFKEREDDYERRLAVMEEEAVYYEAYLTRLLTDQEFMEHVARERLGYSKPGELIFRFKTSSQD